MIPVLIGFGVGLVANEVVGKNNWKSIVKHVGKE